MRNPTPTEQVKHALRQQITQAFKQVKGHCSEEHWREFESFFWKIRPHLEIDYAQFEPSKDNPIVKV